MTAYMDNWRLRRKIQRKVGPYVKAAYDAAALKYFGAFAPRNTPE